MATHYQDGMARFLRTFVAPVPSTPPPVEGSKKTFSTTPHPSAARPTTSDVLAEARRRAEHARQHHERRAASAPLPGVWHTDPDSALAERAEERRDAERAAAARSWLRDNGRAPRAYPAMADPYRGMGAAYDTEQEDRLWAAKRAAIRHVEEGA